MECLEYNCINRSMNTTKDNKQISIEFIYSPMNPADLNSIEGKYPDPLTSKIPNQKDMTSTVSTIGGGEAVARIVSIEDECDRLDDNVSGSKIDVFGDALCVGDWVIPATPGFGTWRSSAKVHGSELIRLPNVVQDAININDTIKDKSRRTKLLISAASLSVNPCTAYRLVHSFIPNLKSHGEDVVIQNGGASSVGICTSQILHQRDIPCLSIIRRGTRSVQQMECLIDYVLSQGKASAVICEEDLFTSSGTNTELLKDSLNNISNSNPRLALNCVGGNSALVLMKSLAHGGAMVTYGGMSLQPVTVPTGLFIFKDIHLYGYWHSQWVMKNSNASSSERKAMIRELSDWIVQNKLNVVDKTKVFPLIEYQSALSYDAISNITGLSSKVVFDCQS